MRACSVPWSVPAEQRCCCPEMGLQLCGTWGRGTLNLADSGQWGRTQEDAEVPLVTSVPSSCWLQKQATAPSYQGCSLLVALCVCDLRFILPGFDHWAHSYLGPLLLVSIHVVGREALSFPCGHWCSLLLKVLVCACLTGLPWLPH